MANPSNPFALPQQAMLKVAQDVSLKMLDAVTKLVELNVETTRAMIADTAEKASARVEAGALPDAKALAAARPSSQEVGAYLKRVMDIVTETNVDLVATLQKHALGFAPEAFAAVARNGMASGNDAMMAAVANPFGAAQEAFRQATETVTEAIKAPAAKRAAGAAAAA